MYTCPQCNRKVDSLLKQVYSSGQVCSICFQLEIKEGLLEELEWQKFQLKTRLGEIMDKSFWEKDFKEEKKYVREQIQICEEKINKLNDEINELEDFN
ncbi:MAG: hypothetical protein ABRQ37_27585 [Candidatus Eremiobacterota bacterium]